MPSFANASSPYATAVAAAQQQLEQQEAAVVAAVASSSSSTPFYYPSTYDAYAPTVPANPHHSPQQHIIQQPKYVYHPTTAAPSLHHHQQHAHDEAAAAAAAAAVAGHPLPPLSQLLPPPPPPPPIVPVSVPVVTPEQKPMYHHHHPVYDYTNGNRHLPSPPSSIHEQPYPHHHLHPHYYQQQQEQQKQQQTAESIFVRVTPRRQSKKNDHAAKYHEIERLYHCNFSNCTKAYGTLNHLNAHVSMQQHGPKRHPSEFKDLRKMWRKQKREATKAVNEQLQHQQPHYFLN